MSTIKTVCGTDGVLETEVNYDNKSYILKLIIETKLAETFSSAYSRSCALTQVIYYLKKFSIAGLRIPNIVLIGDKDECFVLHSNFLLPYLELNYDWSLAPSQAKKHNPDLVNRLTEDLSLQRQCFVFIIDQNFSFDAVYLKIEGLLCNIKTKIPITPQSISYVFDYFSMRILKKDSKGNNKYSPREQVEFFMQLILNPLDCYTHKNRKNIGIFGNHVNISIDSTTFESFTSYYEFQYNAEQKKLFTAICDRLIEDSDRRKNGDFYTPTIWVIEAYQLISQHLKEDWINQYIVWDCAWGTGNLTRDYTFSNLFCSTLEDCDLTIGNKYNKSSCKFQYDFLNDDVNLFNSLLDKTTKGSPLLLKDFKDSKLYRKAPQLLKNLLSKKKLIFFINPPYGTSGELCSFSSRKQKKTNIANTAIAELMQQNSIGPASQQLYAQFIYRIEQFRRLFNAPILLALFSPSSLLTSIQTDAIRKILCTNFGYKAGFLFQASQFADVKNNWAITFTLWGDTSTLQNFPVSIKQFTESGICTLATKYLNPIPKNEKASEWLKKCCTSYKEEYKTFTMSNGITISNGICGHSSSTFAWALMDSNVVEKNQQFVTILPHRLKGHLSAFPIQQDNFLQIFSLFTARRLITGSYANWMNWQDEYSKPNLAHPMYKQWESDSIIYAIFNNKFQHCSLRNISFNNTITSIYNEFFFMSSNEIRNLCLDCGASYNQNDDIYEDLLAHCPNERFLYTQLNSLTFSPDAEKVLNKATSLIKTSFRYRITFNVEHPEYQINTWDAGWYQIRALLKLFDPKGLQEFNSLYHEFESRLYPLVYKLGFLR